jgi:hypothetical protein
MAANRRPRAEGLATEFDRAVNLDGISAIMKSSLGSSNRI